MKATGLTWGAVTISCRDSRALAAFWCDFLGTTVRGEFGQFLSLHPSAPGHPHLMLQQVAEVSPRGGTHLDFHTADLDAETERAVALGATVLQEVADFGIRWRVLADPEGNPFCLVPAN
jgi:predicted enzyme related to lactoylglutathione lyase